MESTLQTIKPVKPPAAYMGGKRLLASRLTSQIDKIPHTLYAEPFVGMGGVFFRRKHRPKTEVINDISGDVVTLFRVLQRHYVPFLEMLKYQLNTRADFERLKQTDAETLTDLERAARFLYLQTISFGGKVVGRAYGVNLDRGAPFDITRLRSYLEDVHARLAGVNIERLTWQEFIPRYDRPDALFYLDPPYWKHEKDYGKGVFERSEFYEMAELLKALKGRFIMSLNDLPEVRNCFSTFNIAAVETTYTANAKRTKKAREVIISN